MAAPPLLPRRSQGRIPDQISSPQWRTEANNSNIYGHFLVSPKVKLSKLGLMSRPLIRTQQKPLDDDTLDDMTREDLLNIGLG